MDVNQNRLKDSLSYLPKTLLYLKLLDIHSIIFGNEEIKELPRSLTALYLNHPSEITNEGLKFLPPDILHLRLEAHKLSDEGIANLPKQLLTLNISNKVFNDVIIKKLPRTLELLALNKSENLTHKGIKHLPRGLLGLELKSCSLTELSLNVLPRSLCYLSFKINKNINTNFIVNLPSNFDYSENLSGIFEYSNTDFDHFCMNNIFGLT